MTTKVLAGSWTVRAHSRTYKFDLYDPEALEAAPTEVEAERGEPLDLTVYFNDTRAGGGRAESPEAKTRAEVEDLLSEMTVEKNGEWPRHDAKLFTAIGRDPQACEISLLFDSGSVSEPAAKRELQAIERLLVSAIDEDAKFDL
ncbi:hypothetical protein [Glycomyces sp. NRRL B-16210]|uniref:hypothetical protein n=1 Tax=Glycomyces sp. NRRL B-16210 TaxID=1463821 RepID=UPI0004C0F33C|nr:hypothetical protein [Glycomyces sp. NRRL B-16210]